VKKIPFIFITLPMLLIMLFGWSNVATAIISLLISCCILYTLIFKFGVFEHNYFIEKSGYVDRLFAIITSAGLCLAFAAYTFINL